MATEEVTTGTKLEAVVVAIAELLLKILIFRRRGDADQVADERGNQ